MAASVVSPQLGLIPVTGVRFNDSYSGYGQFYPSLFYTQQGLSNILSPKSACQREKSPFPTSIHSNPDTHYSGQSYHRFKETTNYSIDQVEPEQNNLGRMEELIPGSPTGDQSACGTLCNGAASHINSVEDGTIYNRSDENAPSSMAVEKATASESLNDTSVLAHEGFRGMDSLRSSQREAALTKFRLKRKDRCFEKKVSTQYRHS